MCSVHGVMLGDSHRGASAHEARRAGISRPPKTWTVNRGWRSFGGTFSIEEYYDEVRSMLEIELHSWKYLEVQNPPGDRPCGRSALRGIEGGFLACRLTAVDDAADCGLAHAWHARWHKRARATPKQLRSGPTA